MKSPIAECRVCGDSIMVELPSSIPAGQLIRAAREAVQVHLSTHTELERLRCEMRHNLESFPEPQRTDIVRDLYRGLLGDEDADGTFHLGEYDSNGVWTVDEVLNSPVVRRLWHASLACGLPHCTCRA